MSFLRTATRPLASFSAQLRLMREASGTVRSFNMARGFGFIVPDPSEDANARDVFVHQTVIKTDGFRFLKVGERVEFEVEDSARGPQARIVTAPGGGPLQREQGEPRESREHREHREHREPRDRSSQRPRRESRGPRDHDRDQ